MKRFILAISLLTSLQAAPTRELSVMDANVYTNMQQNDAARAYNSTISDGFKERIELAPSANFDKPAYYEGELIALDIEVKSSSQSEFRPEFSLGTNTSMKLLKLDYKPFAGGVYRARAYLQAQDANAQASSIDVKLFRASSQIAEAKLLLKSPKITPLSHERNFSGVVADSLELNNLKCTPYDDESIICAADLASQRGAIFSFSAKGAISSSISANNRDYEHNKAFLAMILPAFSKEISFSYFSPASGNFELINKPIVVASEEVSTQSDLAPTSKELGTTLQIICLILALACVGVVVYFRRFYGLLAAAAILAGLGLVNGTSFKTATLKSGSIVRILPTQTATIFERSAVDSRVHVLGQYKDFYKIQLSDDKIGWVHSSSLID